MLMTDMPLNSHNNLPSRSYERTRLVPALTSSPRIDGGRFRGEGVLEVDGPWRLALVDLLLPEHLAVLPVETADEPAMFTRGRRAGQVVEVETLLGIAWLLLADHRGDKDAILPD